jgi:hypothetical protein
MNTSRYSLLPLMAAVTFGSALVACQDLADASTLAPPLAIIRGTLSLAEDVRAPEGDIRLAVLWRTEYGDPPSDELSDPGHPCAVDPSKLPPDPGQWGGLTDPLTGGYSHFRTALAEQQVELKTEFPVQFSLDISAPPPREALDIPLAEYFEPRVMAEGQFVVYRDTNHNGALDPSSFSEPSPDEVLSVSGGPTPPAPVALYALQYVEREPVFDVAEARASLLGTVPGFDAAALERYGRQYDYLDAGYNLVRPDPQALSPTRLAEDHKVELTLDVNASWQRVLCEESCQRPDDYECPANPADLPVRDARAKEAYRSASVSGWYYSDDSTALEGREECSVNDMRQTYSYTRFACQGCVCRVIACTYHDDQLPPDAVLPCERGEILP